MTNEEIRKLLGGYATNTLTDAERKVLFEAALDNQELFNAIQEEQALKDLLADPISRQQVRQALETPAPVKQTAAWWSQRWAWGSAAGAVLAAILIVTAIRWNPSPHRKEVASVGATEQPAIKRADQPPALTKEAAAISKPQPPPAKSVRPSRPTVEQGQAKDEVAAAMSPPAPPAPERQSAPAQQLDGAAASQNAGHSQNASPNVQNSISNQAAATGQQQVQVSPAVSGFRDADRRANSTYQFAPGASGGVAGPLRFSLMKRDSNGGYVPVPTTPDLKKGDAVQLRIVPALSGYVSLSQLDQSGTWKRVFPSSGPGVPVVANSAYTLPAAPIEVTGKDEKFRVTLSLATPEDKPAAADSVMVEKDMKSMKKAKAATIAGRLREPSPLFVDITIGPKK
jgi:hypothetical protein